MSLADEWHDPRGPELASSRPNAQDALDFVRRGFIQVLDERTEEIARAIGLTEAQIDAILGRTSQR